MGQEFAIMKLACIHCKEPQFIAIHWAWFYSKKASFCKDPTCSGKSIEIQVLSVIWELYVAGCALMHLFFLLDTDHAGSWNGRMKMMKMRKMRIPMAKASQVVVSGGPVWTPWFHMLPRFQGSRKAVFDKAIAAMKARQKAEDKSKKLKWHSRAKRSSPNSVLDISLIQLDYFASFCLQ